MHLLDSVIAKLDWAQEKLSAFHDERERFLEGEPYRIIRDGDPNGTKQRYRIQIDAYPPVRLALLAGDVTHTLRSALDNLAWALSLLTTENPYERTAFPIFNKKEEFEKWGKTMIRDVPRESVGVFEELQPYKRGEASVSHPLWIMAFICDVDKHRTLAIFANGLWCHSKASPDPANADRIGFFMRGKNCLQDGDHFDLVVSQGPTTNVDFQVDPVFDIIAQKGSRTVEIPIIAFDSLYKFVRDETIPRFKGFFPNP